MLACFQRLKQLVPAASGRMSRVQLLQRVIDYILDLENTLEIQPMDLEVRTSAVEETDGKEEGKGEGFRAEDVETWVRQRQPLTERFNLGGIKKQADQEHAVECSL
jgi:hypothetical protein